MKAFLKNYRQSPRKVRLVAGLVKGKNVNEAIAELDFLAKRAGFPIKKLLLSAVSNAKQMGMEKDNLFIKELRVDKGITMKRMMPAAMGSGHRINKRTSNVSLVLSEKAPTQGRGPDRIVGIKKSSPKTNKPKVEKKEKKVKAK